ncbi:MAG TPA: sulfite exporter TauE/SafE family protein [Gaiella sp.]|nr:sulfite exporter TauE/SafE family protein [Gaiella sp.]
MRAARREGVPVLVRLALVGLVAGVFSAVFGVGGGIVVVPLLVALVAFPARVAAATSLGAILLTATAGATLWALRGEVRPGYAALVGLPAVAGALVGTSLQQRVSNRALTGSFAVLLAGIAVWLLVA